MRSEAAVTIVSALALLFHPTGATAFDSILKTPKVRVGEKAPIAESLEKPREEGRAVVLVLFPNPTRCGGCEMTTAAIGEAAKKHPGVAFVMLGGGDKLGAMDEETAVVRRLYGFVTTGEAMTFFIDDRGILRKIITGGYNGPALEGMLESLKWADK